MNSIFLSDNEISIIKKLVNKTINSIWVKESNITKKVISSPIVIMKVENLFLKFECTWHDNSKKNLADTWKLKVEEVDSTILKDLYKIDIELTSNNIKIFKYTEELDEDENSVWSDSKIIFEGINNKRFIIGASLSILDEVIAITDNDTIDLYLEDEIEHFVFSS